MIEVAATSTLKVYIIAGEASGDLIGAHLMRSIREQSMSKVLFYGVGGDKMKAEGLNSLFPYYELSMLGAVEVLPYAFNIFTRVSQTAEDIKVKAPDIVITIDSPGFTFRVVKRARELQIASKFVHYVAPTVWVYKPERAQLCAQLFDHMLVLLPFEPPYFTQAGLPCTWVGHPAVVETGKGDGAAFRSKYDIPGDMPLFTLLPGSRKGEVERHMPIFAQTLTLLSQTYPELAMAVAVPQNVMSFVAPFFKDCPFRAVVTSDEQDKKNAMAASQLAIVKSGTVALEVAKMGTPMVVAYKIHPLSAWWLKRQTSIRFVNLINILADREAIPELLQDLCNPMMIASACLALLDNPQLQEQQKATQSWALEQLIPPDGARPSDIAAHTILGLLA